MDSDPQSTRDRDSGDPCFSEQTAVDFVAGRLDPAAKEGVLRHITNCDACRAFLSELVRGSGGAPPRRSSGDAASLAPGARIGRYVLRDLLGAGGMGVVYRAHDPELDRLVALKLLRAREGSGRGAERARIFREAQAMAKLSHPNVVQVHDVGAYDGGVFLALELVEGQTLSDWMQAPHSWREILLVFLSAARGLIAAHAAGLIHRDFKPSNVLLGAAGRVCVGDFGLVRAAQGDTPLPDPTPSPEPEPGATPSGALALALTAAGAVMGTPGYMAPEQYAGEPATALADQFSFCASLYEALYGQRPFKGTHLAELASQARTGQVLPLPADTRVPAFVSRAVLRGLSPRPADRFPSMDALLRALGADPRRARLRWAVGAGALAALIAAGVAVRAAIRPSGSCANVEAELAPIWNADTPALLRAAFAQTGAPRAAREAERTIKAGDAYASSWKEALSKTCNELKRDPTAEQPHLALVCLSREKEEFAALIRVVLQPDEDVVQRAADAVLQVFRPSRCEDPRVLSSLPKVPDEPDRRRQVEELNRGLAYASAKENAGRHLDGQKLLPSLLERARAAHYPPGEAEALSLLGRSKAMSGQAAEGIRMMESAEALYESSAMDREAAFVAANAAFFYLGEVQTDPAKSWIDRGLALLQRAGGDPGVESKLELDLAMLEDWKGHHDESLAHDRRAADLLEQVYGPEFAATLRVRGNIGIFLGAWGRWAEAIPVLERSLQDFERVRGPDHPDGVNMLLMLANSYLHAGRFAEATAIAQRCEGIARASGGEKSELLLKVIFLQSWIAIVDGRWQEGLQLARHTQQIARTAGSDYFTGNSLVLVGMAEELIAQPDRARQSLEAALEILHKFAAQDPTAVEWPELFMAAVETDQHRPRRALPHAEQAIALFERDPHPDPGGPALARFQMARALAETGGDRKQISELIRKSLEELASAPVAPAFRERVQQWAVTHGVSLPLDGGSPSIVTPLR